MVLALVGFAVACVLAGLLLPARFGPAIALVLYVLVPYSYFDMPQVFQLVSPATLVLAIWLGRALIAGRVTWATGGRRVAAAALTGLWVLVVVESLLGGTLLDKNWMSSLLAICVVLWAGVGGDFVSRTLITTTWVALGTGLSLFAVVEKYVWEANEVYGPIFTDAAANPMVQEWATYRATTSLGHPLVNSLFLSIAVVLATTAYLTNHKIRWLVAAALCVVGVLATVSRSGLVATALGVLLVLAQAVWRAGAGRRWRSVAIILVAGGASIWLAEVVFGDRLESSEAAVSAGFRDVVQSVAIEGIESRWLAGYGPGGLAHASFDAGLETTGNFENSWIELALATGLPGFVLFAAAVLAMLATAMVRGQIGVAGSIIVYIVSAWSFNLIFGHIAAHVLLVLLALLAFAPADGQFPGSRSRIEAAEGARPAMGVLR